MRQQHCNNEDMIKEVKSRMGFKSDCDTCRTCWHLEKDNSTDNLGVGDRCNLNPMVSFRVELKNTCANYQVKVVKNV